MRYLPSFLPRELLLSIFPLLEDGGRRADSWCWRAPCHLHVLHGQRGATSSTGLHLNAKWIVFSFLFFMWYILIVVLFIMRPVNKGTAIKNSFCLKYKKKATFTVLTRSPNASMVSTLGAETRQWFPHLEPKRVNGFHIWSRNASMVSTLGAKTCQWWPQLF